MALDLPKLADGFAAPDGARWRALAEKALKGKPIESLTQATYDGVGVRALYTAADAPGGTSVGRARAGAWDIRAVVAAEAAGQALEELEGGATSIELQAYADFTDFAGALSGVLLDLAPLALDAGAALGPAQALADFARRRGLRAAPFAFNLDPFAALARDGAAPAPANVLSLAAKLHAEFPNALVLRADARAVHESGGSEAQELAWMLAAGAGLLRAGEAAGLAPETVSATTLFTLAVGDDATLEIAKLRAARKLWAHALAACGASAPMTLHAVTGARMMTRRDAWTNMLRTTAAGFAAGVGGADVVSILPMTHALGAPTPFAR
ncbi:MAG: methylmalonyl-CoA mutase family protein, partial [Hyphomonadaceae bacterium]